MTFLIGTAAELLQLENPERRTENPYKKKDCALTTQSFLDFMVRPARFERAAYGFEVRRSIQPSYGLIGASLMKPLSKGRWIPDQVRYDGVFAGLILDAGLDPV
jgi:hypothetical protein